MAKMEVFTLYIYIFYHNYEIYPISLFLNIPMLDINNSNKNYFRLWGNELKSSGYLRVHISQIEA